MASRLGVFRARDLVTAVAVASVATHCAVGCGWLWRRWQLSIARRRLREVYGEPSKLVLAKVKDRLDERGSEFVAKSTFVLLASRGVAVDVSPRGDAAGFVSVLDERTLLMPDRRGNNRLDSLENIISDGRVQLLFLVPGLGETLRVGGNARLVYDSATLAPLAVKGAIPKAALEIRISTVYLQCAKAIIRSQLWNSAQHLPPDQRPSAARMLAEQTGLKSAEEMQQMLDEGYKERLY